MLGIIASGKMWKPEFYEMKPLWTQSGYWWWPASIIPVGLRGSRILLRSPSSTSPHAPPAKRHCKRTIVACTMMTSKIRAKHWSQAPAVIWQDKIKFSLWRSNNGLSCGVAKLRDIAKLFQNQPEISQMDKVTAMVTFAASTNATLSSGITAVAGLQWPGT